MEGGGCKEEAGSREEPEGREGRRGRGRAGKKERENERGREKRKGERRRGGRRTAVNGIVKGYFYEEGYIRTSSKEFTLNNLDNKFVHLTNDAIQKNDDEYGKYESGNKLSFSEFQKYLDDNYNCLNINFKRDLLPQIKVNSPNKIRK